jgi:4a-hydroxytetrahydrobiopterin dehydratase
LELPELTMALAKEACVPCSQGAPTLSPTELADLLPQLPGWQLVDGHHLRKIWKFANFQQALDWVNLAGGICEEQGHHAEFSLGWGHAEAVIYTHKVDGLTRADAVLAARFDEAFLAAAVAARDARSYGAYAKPR